MKMKNLIHEELTFKAHLGNRISFLLAFVNVYNMNQKTYTVVADTFSNQSKAHAQAFIDRTLNFYEGSTLYTVINSGIRPVTVDVG